MMNPVKKLWEIVMQGSSEVRDVYEEVLSNEEFPSCLDVPLDQFLDNPRLILPHYMVVDSPAKRQIENRKKAARSMGTNKSIFNS